LIPSRIAPFVAFTLSPLLPQSPAPSAAATALYLPDFELKMEYNRRTRTNISTKNEAVQWTRTKNVPKQRQRR
jgi:hypothetical protein